MRRVVTAFVVAVLCLVGLAPLARAAVIVDAPLPPGVPTALTFGPGDTAAFTVTSPAATTQTLTATGMSPGLVLRLIYTGGTSGPVTIDGSDPSTWFVELGTNGGDTTDQFLQLDVASAAGGDVTLTLTNAPVLDVRVPVGTDVPVTVGIPGQDVRLTFDAGGQDEATLTLGSVVLGDALDGSTAPRFTVTGPDFPFFGSVVPENASGVYGPAQVQRDGDSSWFVDLTGGRTGTFTVHLDLTYAPGFQLAYRADSQLVTLDTPTRVRQVHFTATGFAPTGVQIFAPALTSTAGGPGAVDVQLVEQGASPVTIGTFHGEAATFTTPHPLTQLDDVTLRFVGDGATSGTFFVRLVLAPVPGGTFTTGSTPLELPAGAGARSWTIDAAEGDQYELHLRDVAFGDPTNLGSVTATVLGPNGQHQESTQLTTFSTEEQLGITAFTAGRYTVELSWDGPADFAVTTTLVAVKRTVRTVTATVPADIPVDLTTPGEALEVRLPVRAGHRLALRLVDPVVSGPPDRFGTPPSVSITASSDVLGFEPFSSDDFGGTADGGVYRQTVDAPADGTLSVRFAVSGLASGTARLLVTEPVDTTGTFAPTGTTTIPVVEVGAVADYAFEVTGNGPAALDVAVPALSTAAGPDGLAHVTLVAPDGTRGGTNTVFTGGERLWLDLGIRGASGLPETATGTWHLLFDPLADATGTLAVTRVTPTVTTTAVRPGRTTTLTYAPGDVRRLTFTGRAGQRPVLQLAGDPVNVALVLVGPDGLAVRTFESFEYGGGYAEFEPLPASGTWSIVLDPDGAQAGTQTARLDLVRDPVVAVEPGRLVTATWAVGQNPVYTFRVRKGQHVAVDVRTGVFGGDPAAAQATLGLFGAGTGDFALALASIGGPDSGVPQAPAWMEPGPSGFVAPADGVWRLEVNPFRATTGRITFVVRTASDQVLPGRLGKVTSVRVDKPVQDVALPFDVGPADAGKVLTWQVTGSTFTQARLTLLTPFGTLWEGTTIGPGDSTGTFFSGVPFTGRWTLVVDPVDGATGRAALLFGLGAPG